MDISKTAPSNSPRGGELQPARPATLEMLIIDNKLKCLITKDNFKKIAWPPSLLERE